MGGENASSFYLAALERFQRATPSGPPGASQRPSGLKRNAPLPPPVRVRSAAFRPVVKGNEIPCAHCERLSIRAEPAEAPGHPRKMTATDAVSTAIKHRVATSGLQKTVEP